MEGGRLDTQLERHLNRVRVMQGMKVKVATKEDWEIDPSKLIILEVIGQGAFSTVHRGLYGGQDVAVKVLDWIPEGQTAVLIASLRNDIFKQEVSIWRKLDHPNVAKFIGATKGIQMYARNERIDMNNNVGCIIIEYLPLGTLKSFLLKNRKRKLAFKMVIRLALDLARGLCYLHSKKIVHRDVKTENVVMDKNHSLKLIDFGIACNPASIPTEMIGRAGTAGYMAPEVFANKLPYSRKCDVYSFGICLWEMYCSDLPFPNVQFSHLTPSVYRNMRPEIPSYCPSSLTQVITRCWDADPKKRPEMKEVVTMLEGLATSNGRSRRTPEPMTLEGIATSKGRIRSKPKSHGFFSLCMPSLRPAGT